MQFSFAWKFVWNSHITTNLPCPLDYQGDDKKLVENKAFQKLEALLVACFPAGFGRVTLLAAAKGLLQHCLLGSISFPLHKYGKVTFIPIPKT